MSNISEIKTQNSPKAIGPYSQAIKFGNLIYVSGQLPLDLKGNVVGENIADQTYQSLKNIEGILKEENLSMKNVVKTTVFLKDLKDFEKMNEVYEKFFEEPYPARSCVEVAKLPKGAKIEIEALAQAD